MKLICKKIVENVFENFKYETIEFRSSSPIDSEKPRFIFLVNLVLVNMSISPLAIINAFAFLTPKKRQQLVGQAEDFTETVVFSLTSSCFMLFNISRLVRTKNEIDPSAYCSSLSSFNIYRRWHPYVASMERSTRFYHARLECRLVSWLGIRVYQSRRTNHSMRYDLSEKEN